MSVYVCRSVSAFLLFSNAAAASFSRLFSSVQACSRPFAILLSEFNPKNPPFSRHSRNHDHVKAVTGIERDRVMAHALTPPGWSNKFRVSVRSKLMRRLEEGGGRSSLLCGCNEERDLRKRRDEFNGKFVGEAMRV